MDTIMGFLVNYSLIIIIAIIVIILIVNKKIDSKQLINEIEPYFKFLMEEDYIFLLKARYGEGTEEDINNLFKRRVSSGLIALVIVYFVISISYSSLFISALLGVIVGFLIYKVDYFKLKSYYNRNLYQINLMLPYFLKSLEILIQHYTVPVALNKSIESAPDIFKDGLRKLVAKIEAGDSSIEPYMDFAREYPVRDSMRMMRLLYRLSLGSQESKQQQLILFSKNVSSLQNKAREQKYENRLDSMEKRTMIMLGGTGGGLLILLVAAMVSMMGNI